MFLLNYWMLVVNQLIEYFCYILYPFVNFVLYIDLYWIMKDPFYPQRKRFKYYIFCMLLIIVFVIVMFALKIETLWTLRLYYRANICIINTIFGLASFFLLLRILMLLTK